jgi:hypothetical protein
MDAERIIDEIEQLQEMLEARLFKENLFCVFSACSSFVPTAS